MVSLPSAAAARRPATAAPEPPLEPPGVWPAFQGFSVRPWWGLSVVAPSAPSCRLSLPRITAPAERKLAMTAASAWATAAWAKPFVVATPRTSMLSLMAIGTPSSGLKRAPTRTDAATAASRAASSVRAR